MELPDKDDFILTASYSDTSVAMLPPITRVMGSMGMLLACSTRLILLRFMSRTPFLGMTLSFDMELREPMNPSMRMNPMIHMIKSPQMTARTSLMKSFIYLKSMIFKPLNFP